MRFLFFFLLLFVNCGFVSAQNSAKVSLLTCAEGDELYSTFGHSALRVQYPTGEDLVWNFGLFDFNTPDFYYKFVKGELLYMLGYESTARFLRQYQYEGRDVVEQQLNLTPAQSYALISGLDTLYRPENRYYRYSFLYRNCTTELRDIILKELGAEASNLTSMTSFTHRKLLNTYMYGWTRFGINLVLGSGIDKELDVRASQFLPNNLFEYLDSAKLQNGEDVVLKKEKIDSHSTVVFNRKMGMFTPTVIFAIILALVAIGLFVLNKTTINILLTVIFIKIGIMGALITFLMMFSEHKEFAVNFNVLWCNPLFLILPMMGKMKKVRMILQVFLLLCILAAWIIWGLKIQSPELGFIFISITLFIALLNRLNFVNKLKQLLNRF